jgi:alkylhydroperoxidase family enzyme
MIGFFLKAALRSFGRRYDYDVSYMEEIADAHLPAAFKLGLANPLFRHRYGFPARPYYAAKFIATRHAGCGPCVELVIRMAEDEGVPRAALAAIAKPGAKPGQADEDMRLSAEFAYAMLEQRPNLPELSETVTQRFGKEGRIMLTAAVISGQFYPLLKRGLGYAKDCTMLPPEFRP